MSQELDPKKQPHLRPGLNPFSIFAGDEAVPDIFDDEATSLHSHQRKKSAGKPIMAVPQLDSKGFSLGTPAAAAKPKSKKNSKSKPAAATRSVPAMPAEAPKQHVPLERERQPYMTAAPVVQDDSDDSFDDDDDEDHAHPALAGPAMPPPPMTDDVVSKLESRLAQSEAEIRRLREQNAAQAAALEREGSERMRLEEELRVASKAQAEAAAREAAENAALEAALAAIERKLADAEKRAATAEAALEAAGAGGMEETSRAAARMRRKARDLALEFSTAEKRAAEMVRELGGTLGKLHAQLASFEKIVPEEEQS